LNDFKKSPVVKSLGRNIFILVLMQVIAISGLEHVHAQRVKSSLKAGEQRNAEKGLKDNRYFFYFINSSISNFGTAEHKKLFKEAIQRDLISQLLYMRFMFLESFAEIRKAQRILVDLYRVTLKKDIKASKDLLNQFAPTVIASKDKSALGYLGLGYRDMKVAQTYLAMADNYRESLYSLRLYKYVHAIKKAKHGRRYAFRAILLSLDLLALHKERSEDYVYERGDEILHVKARIKGITFEELEKRLSEIPPAEKTEYYRTIHLDNFYRTNAQKSFYDVIWETPDLHEIKEYKEYLRE
jgi:hypothetical protein